MMNNNIKSLADKKLKQKIEILYKGNSKYNNLLAGTITRVDNDGFYFDFGNNEELREKFIFFEDVVEIY